MTGKRKDKARKQSRDPKVPAVLRDRRIAAATTLAADVQLSPDSPPHKIGAPVVWVHKIQVAGYSAITFPVPLPSELLLRAAEVQLRKVSRQRAAALKMAAGGRYMPHGERTINDHAPLFQFFQEAMAGTMLAYAALNNFANEVIPNDFELQEGGSASGRDVVIHRGAELRLSRVLAAVFGRPNLQETEPLLWGQFEKLKGLRDGIEHASGGSHGFVPGEDQQTIFAKLLNEPDLLALARTVRDIIDLYRSPAGGQSQEEVSVLDVSTE